MAEPIRFHLFGNVVTAEAGTVLAAVMLNQPRQAQMAATVVCAMGICHACRARVDGVIVRACLTEVVAGMEVTIDD